MLEDFTLISGDLLKSSNEMKTWVHMHRIYIDPDYMKFIQKKMDLDGDRFRYTFKNCNQVKIYPDHTV